MWGAGSDSGGLSVGFCFTDRDFATASPITSFSFSEKEKEGKRKTAQGTAPRSEPRVAPADRDEVKTGAQCGSAPRDPPENGQTGRDKQQRCCAQRRKFRYSVKTCLLASRAARFRLCLPLEGKVPEGQMRCRLRVAEPFTGEKVTLFSVTRCRATPHHRLRAELSRCGSCQ